MTNQAPFFQAPLSLSSIWHHFQGHLFPCMQEELPELTRMQQQLVEVLEMMQLETHLPYSGLLTGRPLKSRESIARAFTAKAVYNLSTTEILIDRLRSDISLRRICGWEKRSEIPSNSTFSRAFAEFAETKLTQRIHQAIIDQHPGYHLIYHISRDSTGITAREKPEVIQKK